MNSKKLEFLIEIPLCHQIFSKHSLSIHPKVKTQVQDTTFREHREKENQYKNYWGFSPDSTFHEPHKPQPKKVKPNIKNQVSKSSKIPTFSSLNIPSKSFRKLSVDSDRTYDMSNFVHEKEIPESDAWKTSLKEIPKSITDARKHRLNKYGKSQILPTLSDLDTVNTTTTEFPVKIETLSTENDILWRSDKEDLKMDLSLFNHLEFLFNKQNEEIKAEELEDFLKSMIPSDIEVRLTENNETDTESTPSSYVTTSTEYQITTTDEPISEMPFTETELEFDMDSWMTLHYDIYLLLKLIFGKKPEEIGINDMYTQSSDQFSTETVESTEQISINDIYTQSQLFFIGPFEKENKANVSEYDPKEVNSCDLNRPHPHLLTLDNLSKRIRNTILKSDHILLESNNLFKKFCSSFEFMKYLEFIMKNLSTPKNVKRFINLRDGNKKPIFRSQNMEMSQHADCWLVKSFYQELTGEDLIHVSNCKFHKQCISCEIIDFENEETLRALHISLDIINDNCRTKNVFDKFIYEALNKQVLLLQDEFNFFNSLQLCDLKNESVRKKRSLDAGMDFDSCDSFPSILGICIKLRMNIR